ncbi:MAG: DUF4199 family protein [Raineya sp.]|jgi:hypothetical protein|nr:DUF4199 family protein [Raineya sp.]
MIEDSIRLAQLVKRNSIIFGVASGVFSIAMFFFNVTALDTIFWIVMIAVAMIDLKKHNHGFMDMTTGFKMGLYISIISTSIIFLYRVLHYRIIDPEAWHILTEDLKRRMDYNQKVIDRYSWFFFPEIFFVLVILGSIAGMGFSVILSLIFQKDPVPQPEPKPEDDL